ncbi:MAG: hypothetical protein JNM99_03200 [Verrucomicrobiaceae bacterium]|nr:hypothetical protein [Verrucomicrobiaceae bacterium]
MKAASIDLSSVGDAHVIDVPKVAELQMELRALKGMPGWREIRSALLSCVAPALVIGNFLFNRAATPSALDFIACFLMALLPLTMLVLFLERRSRQIRLMEALLHCLAENQNEHRRILERRARSQTH